MPDLPIIVVCLKKDLRDDREVVSSLERELDRAPVSYDEVRSRLWG